MGFLLLLVCMRGPGRGLVCLYFLAEFVLFKSWLKKCGKERF